VDRSAVDPAEVTFATIWGACDEDLLRWTLAEADRDFAAGTPFHFFVMTTSNHRPYTYPEGRIDIPSKTGRNGAVKYTDYAIGRFVDEARTRPWFANTIFVVVADHCASSAGKAELTVPKYRIPMIFYNPELVGPGEVDRLASQVDFPPTLLAYLGWSYDSLFFGRDVLGGAREHEWAFIGNYQTLGLLTENRLQTLRPNRKNATYRFDRRTGAIDLAAADRELLEEAVAFYQGAGVLFLDGRYTERALAD
jgi:phosphoglycerol transferase MdoB-like AlkP superfamily enzyme